jgi:hypothetical protein
VQLRWTDIEIRKHRLHNVDIYPDEPRTPQKQEQKESSPKRAASPPPLETPEIVRPSSQIVEVDDVKDYN